MSPTVAPKGRWRQLIVVLNCGRRLPHSATRVFTVTIDEQGTNNHKGNDAPKKARFFVATTGRWLLVRKPNHAIGAQEVFCFSLSILVCFYLERE